MTVGGFSLTMNNQVLWQIFHLLTVYLACFDTEYTEGATYFTPLNLKALRITEPLTHTRVETKQQCVLVCLNTPGCQAIAIQDGICLPFDGRLTFDRDAIYETAYWKEGLRLPCIYNLTKLSNVQIITSYHGPPEIVTLGCVPGYVGREANVTTGPICVSSGYPHCQWTPEFGGHRYYINNGGESWQNSYDFCQSLGGWLTDIQSQEENNFLVQLFHNQTNPPPNNEGSYWIGGLREHLGDVFKWMPSNQSLVYEQFAQNEPTHWDSEKCLGMWNIHDWNYAWGNGGCSIKLGFVCKFLSLDI